LVNVKDVLDMVRDNTLKTGFPLPAPRDVVYRWAADLGLPGKGGAYLYTGGLYQLVPYINSLVRQLESLEESRSGGFVFGIAKRVSKILDLSRIVKPERGDVEYSSSVLRSIVRLLDAAGIGFAYLYEADMYSGILLHDLGLMEEFAEHAGRVYRVLREKGVERVITVDPHTTYALRSLYPRFVDGYSLEVDNYLELLYENLGKGSLSFTKEDRGDVVIHDPCYYARFDNILEPPRRLLEAAGYRVLEPRRSGLMTYCCGGPVEAVSPSLALRISMERMQELREKSRRVVTLCPICYANLSRARGDAVVRDIALYLGEALG